MTNSTPLYWTASGGSLHTHAWRVKTLGGTRNQLPPLRGEDVLLPHVTGRQYVRKLPDGMTRTLEMHVLGLNPDGSVDSSMTKAAKLQNNWRYLMTLMKGPGQFPLAKRFYVGDEIKVAVGKAEMLSPPAPSALGATRWDFAVDLWMANPYFYTSVDAQTIGDITVMGDAATERILISMAPGRITFADGNWIQYNGTGTVVIDTAKGLAKVGSTVVNGLITRNPNFRQFAMLYPGLNDLSITGAGGTIAYKAAWE